MNKKGFTLVELLAVISILAILVIIAIPNVVRMFNNAKKNSFETEVKNIFKTAQSEWMSESMFDAKEREYAKCKNNDCPNPLKLSSRDELEYYVKIDGRGKVVEFSVTDGSYQYHYSGNNLKIEDIKDVDEISKIGTDQVVTVSCNKSSNTYKYYSDGTSLYINGTVPSDIQLYDSYEDVIENTNRYYFIRLNIENDIIKSADIMYLMEGNEYTIPLNSDDTYEERAAYLISAFGEANCVDYGSNIYCNNPNAMALSTTDWIHMYASVDDSGNISVGDHYSDGSRCYLWGNSSFYCG